MECNHRVFKFHSDLAELENIMQRKQPKVDIDNVPCNGCTLCCHGDAIRILPGDDPEQYNTVPHDHFPSERMLSHKQNGDCLYLLSSGCSIHPTRPLMCKEMDCRNLARSIKKKDLKRYNVPLRVWLKGRQLIGRG